MYKDLGSWRTVAHVLNLSPRTVWRYANTAYVPKRLDIRRALGLEPVDGGRFVTYVRQIRDRRGMFKHGAG